MDGYVCSVCGERNAAGAEFCVACNAFLGWDQVGSRQGSRADSRSSGTPAREADPPNTATPVRAADQAHPERPRGRFLVTAEQDSVTLMPTGEVGVLSLRLANTSTIVDGYVVEAPGAPSWLRLTSDQVRLLPGTDQATAVRLSVASPTLLPAQQVPLTIRVRSMSQPPAHADVPVLVTVPVVEAPVRLRAEPRLIRARDTENAACTMLLDNPSNRPVQLRFTGSDPELAVTFGFTPAVLDIPPGGTGSVQVRATATGPDPGQEVSRILTLAALDGSRSVETVVTMQQATSVRVEDPPVTLTVEPALLRVRDSTVGRVRIFADNRGGTQPTTLQLAASDPEEQVLVTWTPAELRVPPGGTGAAEGRFEAPLPDAGTEVSRTVTVTAVDGRRTSTATVTFVQVASASPMTTLAVRLDPAVVRLRDADLATTQLTLDNRRGRAGIRLFLNGTDPERALGFAFAPAMVDLGPGQVATVGLQLSSQRPQPGQELSHPFTVTATDGQTGVDASGTLVQSSSRAAIEVLALRLDPSVLRLDTRRRGQLNATIDNRRGAQPVRVWLKGEDPENVVNFEFAPGVLDVPAGQVATAAVRVHAPRPASGRDLSRPFGILASDGSSETHAGGSLIQSAADRRPVARALFTVIGSLIMIFGALAPWLADGRRGVDLNARAFGIPLNLGKLQRFEPLILLVSVGLLVAALGVLALIGLTGRSGRLTRFAAFLGTVLMVGLGILAALTRNVSVGGGLVLVLAGCVFAYIGGRLVRR